MLTLHDYGIDQELWRRARAIFAARTVHPLTSLAAKDLRPIPAVTPQSPFPPPCFTPSKLASSRNAFLNSTPACWTVPSSGRNRTGERSAPRWQGRGSRHQELSSGRKSAFARLHSSMNVPRFMTGSSTSSPPWKSMDPSNSKASHSLACYAHPQNRGTVCEEKPQPRPRRTDSSSDNEVRILSTRCAPPLPLGRDTTPFQTLSPRKVSTTRKNPAKMDGRSYGALRGLFEWIFGAEFVHYAVFSHQGNRCKSGASPIRTSGFSAFLEVIIPQSDYQKVA